MPKRWEGKQKRKRAVNCTRLEKQRGRSGISLIHTNKHTYIQMSLNRSQSTLRQQNLPIAEVRLTVHRPRQVLGNQSNARFKDQTNKRKKRFIRLVLIIKRKRWEVARNNPDPMKHYSKVHVVIIVLLEFTCPLV